MLHGAGIFTNILPHKSFSFVGQYSSTMEYLGMGDMGSGQEDRAGRKADSSELFPIGRLGTHKLILNLWQVAI